MARTRSIKPAFFTNEVLSALPYRDRLLFVGLWCIADRDGRLEDRPLRLRAELFPYDHEIDMEESLVRLAHHGFIHRYVTGNSRFIEVINFKKHQSPHHTERRGVIPAPPVNGEVTCKIPPSTLPPLLPSTLIKHQPPVDVRAGARFEEFWSRYWRKTAKAAAAKTYRKIDEATHLRILAALAHQESEYLGRTPDKRPHATTWLNQKRWEDEPDPVPDRRPAPVAVCDLCANTGTLINGGLFSRCTCPRGNSMAALQSEGRMAG